MSILHKKRLSKLHFVILTVTNLASSEPAFFGHQDSLEHEIDSGQLDRGWEDMLQAVGSPAVQPLSARLTTQSTEQRVAACPDQISTFHPNRPSIFSLRAHGNDTPSIDLGDPAHQSGAMEQFTDPLDFYHKLEHRNDVAAKIGVVTADRPQPFYLTSEYAEAGISPSWNLISDPQLCPASVRLQAVHNTWEQAGGLIAEQSLECSQLSDTEGSLFETPKFQSQDSFGGFARTFQAVEAPLLPQSNRTPLKRNRSTQYHEKKTPKIKPMAKGRTLSSKAKASDVTGAAQPIFKSSMNLKDDEYQHESKKTHTNASRLTEAQSEVHFFKNELLNELLDPEKHGYVNSLKSLIRLIMTSSIQPDASLILAFWLKETDFQDLVCVWERAKLPYPRPFEIESLRRTHVSKQLVAIAALEVERTWISQKIYDLAESLKNCINENISQHRDLPFSVKFKKGEFGKGLVSKVRDSTLGALFLVKMITSVFPKDGHFITSSEEDSIKAWEFFQRFWKDFSYFQPDLKQKYSGFSLPVKTPPYPTRILENVGKNITRPNHPRENLDLSWLLAETWFSDQRPSLYLQMVQKGGKMDRRVKAIIHQFITYIKPKLSKPPKYKTNAK